MRKKGPICPTRVSFCPPPDDVQHASTSAAYRGVDQLHTEASLGGAAAEKRTAENPALRSPQHFL